MTKAQNIRFDFNKKGQKVVVFDYENDGKMKTTTLLPKFSVVDENGRKTTWVVNQNNVQEAADALAESYVQASVRAHEKEANMSEEEKAARSQAGKEAYAKSIEGLTEAELDARREAAREASRRAHEERMAKMTPEEREAEKERQREAGRKAHEAFMAKMSPEEQEAYRERQAEQSRKAHQEFMAKMSDEEKEAYHAKQVEQGKKAHEEFMAKMTPEEQEAYRAKQAEQSRAAQAKQQESLQDLDLSGLNNQAEDEGLSL